MGFVAARGVRPPHSPEPVFFAPPSSRLATTAERSASHTPSRLGRLDRERPCTTPPSRAVFELRHNHDHPPTTRALPWAPLTSPGRHAPTPSTRSCPPSHPLAIRRTRREPSSAAPPVPRVRTRMGRGLCGDRPSAITFRLCCMARRCLLPRRLLPAPVRPKCRWLVLLARPSHQQRQGHRRAGHQVARRSP
jgi:hypothetical protein